MELDGIETGLPVGREEYRFRLTGGRLNRKPLISLKSYLLLVQRELVRVDGASEKRPEQTLCSLDRKETHDMSKIFAVLPVALLAFACGGGEATPEAASPEAPAEAAPAPAEGDAAAAPAEGDAKPAEGDAKPAEEAKPAEPAK